jgi:hypothetical protein
MPFVVGRGGGSTRFRRGDPSQLPCLAGENGEEERLAHVSRMGCHVIGPVS